MCTLRELCPVLTEVPYLRTELQLLLWQLIGRIRAVLDGADLIALDSAVVRVLAVLVFVKSVMARVVERVVVPGPCELTSTQSEILAACPRRARVVRDLTVSYSILSKL